MAVIEKKVPLGGYDKRRKNDRIRLACRRAEQLARPLSKLDKQAKHLGVYTQEYHCLNRIERKSIVSTALSLSSK